MNVIQLIIVAVDTVLLCLLGQGGSLDVANIVDRELFQEIITRPHPVKLYDVNRSFKVSKSTAAVQV